MNLRTHLKLAAISLAIACVLWLGVHNEDRITIPLLVQVNYDHEDDVVHLSDVKEVEVRVRGSRNRLATVSRADVSVTVSNKQGFTGRRLEFLDGKVKTPFGIEVDSVEPARIEVEYDRLATLGVPVEVSWDGEPADGWRVDENTTRAEPARVQVSGPSKLLAELERVRTLPVSVEGAKDAVRAVGVELQPPGSRLSLIGPVAVAAMIPVVPRIGTRSFPNVPISVLHGEWETSPPNPARLEVRVEGPLPSLRRLPLSAIRLTVDMRNKEPRSDDYRVAVLNDIDQSLCEGCTVQHLSPQVAVDVAVRRSKRSPSKTPAQPEATETQVAAPAAAIAPAGADGTPDEPGRTG